MTISKRFALLPAVALVAGCASPDTAFPTLAIRDAERVSGTMAVPAPPAPPLPTPLAATQDRAISLTQQALSAHQAFLAAAPATRERITRASGAAQGSERWAQAQVAIAGLEAQRSAVMIALADLDRLALEAAVAGQAFATLADRRDEVAALADQETALINALLETLEQ